MTMNDNGKFRKYFLIDPVCKKNILSFFKFKLIDI